MTINYKSILTSYDFGISIIGSDLLHVQLGLWVPSQHCVRPSEQPQTPSCQEQHPLFVNFSDVKPDIRNSSHDCSDVVT